MTDNLYIDLIMNNSMALYEHDKDTSYVLISTNMVLIIGFIISLLHTISIIYLLSIVFIIKNKLKILYDLEDKINSYKAKMNKIYKNNGIVAKYIKECSRHCSGKVKEYDYNNYRVFIEFFDYRQPYTVDVINKSDPDNGWFSVMDIEIEDDVRDVKFMPAIKEIQYHSYEDMLNTRNILCLLHVVTIYDDDYFIVTKCKTQLKVHIKKMLDDNGVYYKSIEPLIIQHSKLLDEAEENMLTSFSIRFDESYDVDNDIRSFTGTESDMIDEFHNFFNNHPDYKIKKND